MTPTASAPAATYVVNRRARITELGGDERGGWSVEAPIRGQGLRRTTVCAAERPEVRRCFQLLGHGVEQLEIDTATAIALVEAGVLVLPHHEARPVGFSVPLADHQEAPVGGPLHLNPLARPAVAPCGDPFDIAPVVEVRDPWRRATFLYWLDPEQAASLVDLVAGRPPDDLPRHVAAAFQLGGVLVGDGTSGTDPARPGDRGVAEQGFSTLRCLLPAPYTSALQRYVRARVEEGYLPLGDAQSARRYVAHNDPVATWLHRLLLPALQPFVGRRLQMSYSYLIAYLEGADLPWHTDRAQCEYTLSLTVDSAPEERPDAVWPLHLATPAGPSVAVLLAPGDAVLFKGRELAHHRDPLPAGHTAASLLLHFVDDDFDGPLD